MTDEERERERWELTMFDTFAEAQFAIERKLAELRVPLDPRRLRIGPADDNSATIVHPTKEGRFVIARFMLPGVVNPWEFDAAAYVAQFKFKSVAH